MTHQNDVSALKHNCNVMVLLELRYYLSLHSLYIHHADNSPTGQFSLFTCIGPQEWFYLQTAAAPRGGGGPIIFVFFFSLSAQRSVMAMKVPLPHHENFVENVLKSEKTRVGVPPPPPPPSLRDFFRAAAKKKWLAHQ